MRRILSPSTMVRIAHSKRSQAFAVPWLAALAWLAPCWVASAAELRVTRTDDSADGACDADCSLREAILAANRASGKDTILLPEGIYVLSRPGAGEDLGETGDLDVSGELELLGAGVEKCTIDARQLDRVLDVRGPRSRVQIEGVTLQGGQTRAPGGGVRNEGYLGLRHVSVRDSSTLADEQDGGGIASVGKAAALRLYRCNVQGNSTGDDGGGIYNEGWLLMEESSILQNGAGLKSKARSANAGGGLRNEPEGLVICLRSIFAGNAAKDYGGGVFNRGEAYFKDCTISGNQVRGPGQRLSGAGVFSNGITSLSHCTIAFNRGPGPGAGLFVENRPLTLRSSIVAFNADDLDPTQQKNCAGPIRSSGHNFETTGTCQLTRVELGDRGSVDLQLAPLADNGGPTPTHALSAGSPAIDGAGELGCPPLDQRGLPRQDGDGDSRVECDAGAFELQPASRPAAAPGAGPG